MTADIILRSRAGTVNGRADSEIVTQIVEWHPRRTAAIICDMWDTHHCISAAKRAAEMASRMNEVIKGLREQGVFIIHAPSGCIGFYEHRPARRRAVHAPHVAAPVEFDWNVWNSARELPLPPAITDPGPCCCASAEPCCQPGPSYPWTRQIATIEIDDADAISDDGQEVFNLLEQYGIETVVIMGVHTNICVLSRPFGIRQMVYLGKQPLLCRDLTDSFLRMSADHLEGTELVIEHIERYWCPTVTSDQLVGGKAFSFSRGN